MALDRWLLNCLFLIQTLHVYAQDPARPMATAYVKYTPQFPPGWNYQGCSAEQQTQLTAALHGFQEYVDAGLEVAKNLDATKANKKLFATFFDYNTISNDMYLVRRVFGSLNFLSNGRVGKSVIFKCDDPDNFCESAPAASFIDMTNPFVRGTPSRNSLIRLCPSFFTSHFDLANPCDENELEFQLKGQAPSAALTLLHTMLHMENILDVNHKNLFDIATTVAEARALARRGDFGLSAQVFGFGTPVQPRLSINNYVIFAKWAYMLLRQNDQCYTSYPLFGAIGINTRQPIWAVEKELRKLLGVQDSSITELVENKDFVTAELPNNGTITNDTIISGPFNVSSTVFHIIDNLNLGNLSVLPAPASNSYNISYTNMTSWP